MKTKTFNPGAITKKRIELDLTISDISYEMRKDGMKVSETTLRNWERGDTSPNAPQLAALARALMTDNLDDFFSEVE